MSSRMQRFMARFWQVIAIALGAILVLFALQNLARVELNVLFWTFEARRFVVIGFSFAIGFAIGWLIRAYRGGRSQEPGPDAPA
ncbi:MAG: LapA family protein [Rhodospirillales bacterium]|nr:MAG: LapA family protein [Rhodospirillales bacterium]